MKQSSDCFPALDVKNTQLVLFKIALKSIGFMINASTKI